MDTSKIAAGAPFPEISWPAVGGGLMAPSEDQGWGLLIVYRGKHCPLRKQYLNTLNGRAQTIVRQGRHHL